MSTETQPTNPQAAPAATPTPAPPAAVANPLVPPVTPQAEAPAAPAPAPQDEIAKVAEEFGFSPADFAGVESPEVARQFAKAYLQQIARTGEQGLSSLAAPQQPPQQQYDPQPQIRQLDLKAFGLDEEDPAAKAIRHLESMVGRSNQAALQIAEYLQQQEQQQAHVQRAQVRQQADQLVSGFQDPLYGVAGKRTAFQEWNVKRLYDTADQLLIGAHRQGRPIPPVEARLRQARALLAQQDGQAAPQPPAPTGVGGLAHVPANVAPSVQQMKLTDKWSDNPDLLALVKR